MSNGQNTQRAATVTGSGTGAQPAVQFQLGPKESGVVRVILSATATLTIEGRMGPDDTYVTLNTVLDAGTANVLSSASAATITASGVYYLPIAMADMRVNISANTGNVTVWIRA